MLYLFGHLNVLATDILIEHYTDITRNIISNFDTVVYATATNAQSTYASQTLAPEAHRNSSFRSTLCIVVVVLIIFIQPELNCEN